MIGIGSKLRWQNGKLLYPSQTWKSPTKRRIPRLLIENRALEVGILIYINEPWVVFEESDQKADQIEIEDSEHLELYQHRYQLIPSRFKRQDTYEWIKKLGNALLFWGKELKYYIKATKRSL